MLSLIFVLTASTAAHADRLHADECAAGLTGLSLETYHAAIIPASRGRTLRQAIEPFLRPLVEDGKVAERDARKAGFSAAMCVRLVHRPRRQTANR